MSMEKLSLVNVCEGSLEQQFQAAYPQIIQALKTGGKKATVTMKLEFKRPDSSSTLASIKASFDAKLPPADPRAEVYSFNADNFRIEAEALPETQGEQNVLPFTAAVNK